LEPLTHFLTGAVLSRAGFNRTTALATSAMTLAAEAPDLDIVMYAAGPVIGFQHHRGFTHTFLGTPLVALLVVIVLFLLRSIRARFRPPGPAPRWGLLFVYAWIAALSHLLLDYTNSYGVRPFMPLSYEWYAWDIVSIIEPMLYVFLLGGLILPALFGLINAEIGYRSKGPRGRVGAIVALIGVLAVWGVRDYQHRRALAAMDAITYLGNEPLQRAALPYMFNPFRWYGVVETDDAYLRMNVDSLTPAVDPQGTMQMRYKPPETPVSVAAKRTYLGRVYLDWSRFPVLEVEPRDAPGGGYEVRFRDLRFAYPNMRRQVLGATVLLDANLNVVAQGFGIGRQAERLREGMRGGGGSAK
jgi:inner membrane protein